MSSNTNELPKVDARFFAAVFLIAVALAAGIGGYFYGQNNTQITSAKSIQTIDTLPAAHNQLDSFLQDVKSETSNEKMRPIRSRLEKNGDKTERKFSFPDYPIGDVRWKTGNTFSSRSARGDDCYVPAGTPITLELDAFQHAAVLDNPNLFLRIGPTEFGGLTIKGAHLMDPSLVSEMLNYATTWSALQTVVLESINGDNSVMLILNAMPQVTSLRLSNIANLDGNWLAHQPFVCRQEKLFLSNIDAEPTIRQLATTNNANLRLLAIENAGVSSSVIASLQNCRCLATLIFEDKNADDEKFKAITQIRSLVTLAIKSMRLTKEQIRILSGDKSLTVIYLPAKYYKDSIERADIKRIDPRFQFDDN